MKRLMTLFAVSSFINLFGCGCFCLAQNANLFLKSTSLRADTRLFCNNSSNSDFAPFIWNDLIFITSSRLTEENRRNINPVTKQPFLNVYAIDRNCEIAPLKFLPPGLNEDLNCGPVTLAQDTTILIITKNYGSPNRNRVQNLCLVYYLRKNRQWSDELSFPFNDPEYSLQHPFYEAGSHRLYFSSDVPGGYGKFDLYRSYWNGETWTRPENLGPAINSPYNETFPCITPDGDLVYTTDFPGTFGGLDLILFRDNMRYLLPEPLNSRYDDFAMTFKDRASGYFSSNRPQEKGGDNIYSVLISYLDTMSFLIRVVDRDTRVPVPGVDVDFRSGNPSVSNHLVTRDNGTGFVYRGTEDTIQLSFLLRKNGYIPKEITTGNFRREGDLKILTLRIDPEPVKEDTLFVIGIRPKKTYFIILDSYKNHAQAELRAEVLKKELQADIILLPVSREGFSRISYGRYESLDDAQRMLNSIKPKVNPEAWIFAEPN